MAEARGMKILLVEDETDLARQVARALGAAGHEVEIRHDGLAALGALKVEGFEALVLDVNLPGCSGLEVLKVAHALRPRPVVLLLTARAEIGDRVAGLNAGADDYLTKPFALEELVARVASMGRRGQGVQAEQLVQAGGYQLDAQRRRLLHGGQTVALSPREYDLLAIFMQAPGRVFTRDELCERIWERAHDYDTRTVEIYIMRLRKKLAGSDAPVIETVRGSGYSMRFPS